MVGDRLSFHLCFAVSICLNHSHVYDSVWFVFIIKTALSQRFSFIPYLTAVSCGRRPYIPNGHYTSWTHTTFGGWAYYRCYSGYRRSGSSFIRCQASGNWSPRPYCAGNMLGIQHVLKLIGISFIRTMHTAVSCGPPPSIGNGFINSSTGTTFGETTTYSCDSGYTLSGSDNIACQANMTWETPPVCSRESFSKIASQLNSFNSDSFKLYKL